MKRLLAIILVCALIAGVGIGCKKAEVKPTEQVVNLGGIFPITGGSATLGLFSKNGETMAVEEFNAAGGATIDGVKTTINLIVEDDTASPEVAASATQKLINQDKVIGIIGGIMSSISLAIAPIAQAAGVPEIATTSTNTKVTLVGDYIFRTCFIDSFQAPVVANYVWNTMKLKTAACLFDNSNDATVEEATMFKAAFEKDGGKVVAFEAFTDEQKTIDFNAQLTKIKAAKPEFLYIPAFYGANALELKQARAMGLNIPAGGADGADSPDLVKIGGAAVEGFIFSDHFFHGDPAPKVQAFVAAYTAKYGEAPGAHAALAYDAAGLFLDAFKTAGSIKGSDIRDAIKNTTFSGVAGAYKFDANRNPIKAAVILQIKNGQQTFLATVNP
jgi:branched-chain amino acid transport system substrate-binding protein